MAFEPTPGRGAPSAAEYTQVPAAQASLVQPADPEGPITTTTPVPLPSDGVIEDDQLPEDLTGGSELPTETSGGGFDLPLGTILRVLAVLAVIGAYVGGVPAWHWYRRERRRRQVETPADGVETAWAEASEKLELGYGLIRRPSETRREYATRLSEDMRVPAEAMDGLADTTTIARYHPAGLTETHATQAAAYADQIDSSVNQKVSRFGLWKRMIDPRRLLRPTARITMSSAPPVRPDPAVDLNGHRPEELVDA